MTGTDFITFFLSIFLLIRGASRGFMNSLIPPFSIIVTTVLSTIYYQNTHDVIPSLIIGLIGPLFLNFLLKFLLKEWAGATNTEIKPDFLSCLGGSILTLIWGWVFIIFALILLVVLPPWGKTLTTVHNDVSRSTSYTRIAEPWEGRLFAYSKQNVPAATNTSLSFDANSLAEDPRFQKIIQDPDVQKEIDAHDIVKLMSNPKIQALTRQIMSDPATMKKVLALYSSQAQLQGRVPVGSTKNP
jgi:hypothetical protein